MIDIVDSVLIVENMMRNILMFLVSMTALVSIANADQMTAAKSGCAGCHQMAMKTVGPSIKDIAAKYTSADINGLVAIVKSGKQPGDLIWGSIPMPASPAPEADIKKVVEWMLSQ
ncbi:MAG: c-type cytochrome [Aestuariibacter sp.]|nr:c-type cytochrome [Aestuariibacter sp.]